MSGLEALAKAAAEDDDVSSDEEYVMKAGMSFMPSSQTSEESQPPAMVYWSKPKLPALTETVPMPSKKDVNKVAAWKAAFNNATQALEANIALTQDMYESFKATVQAGKQQEKELKSARAKASNTKKLQKKIRELESALVLAKNSAANNKKSLKC